MRALKKRSVVFGQGHPGNNIYINNMVGRRPVAAQNEQEIYDGSRRHIDLVRSDTPPGDNPAAMQTLK